MLTPNNNRNWVSEPTKKEATLVFIAWLVGFLLTLVAVTEVFTKSPFQSKNVMMVIVLIFSTFIMVKVCGNYIKANKKQ
jgi:nicotinamide riboside transporter PnuC